MFSIRKVVIDGAILSVIASLLIVVSLRFNPRMWLQDYPQDIQDRVPPKTKEEKRQALVVGIPFLIVLVAVPFYSTLVLSIQGGSDISFFQLFLNAFGVAFVFNLVDLLLLDWLMFSTITPKFLVIPGTEGMEEYRDYYYHFRAFLIGTVLSVVAGLVIAGTVDHILAPLVAWWCSLVSTTKGSGCSAFPTTAAPVVFAVRSPPS